MRKYILIIILILLHISSFAQEIIVEAEIDSSIIYIGDHAVYTITLTQDTDLDIKLPVFTDTLYDKIEIISQTTLDSSFSKEGDLILQKKYIITSFDTGFYQIPPYSIELADEQGVKRFYSDYVPLEVVRVDISPSDSTDVIFDIIQPGNVGIGLNEILPWVLLLLVLIILIWLLYKYLPHKKQKQDDNVILPSEPIHIIAFREFDKLEKRELWQKGRIKEYYSCLTEILRNYIQMNYAISAVEMTSEEIIDALKNTGNNDKKLIKILREILTNADFSKFAKYKHNADTNINSLLIARDYVKNTHKKDEDINQDTELQKNNSSGKELIDE